MLMAAKPDKKPRGTPTILPAWWLDEIRVHTQGRTLEQLAADLSALSPREEAWDRSTVGKFLKGKWPTIELMLAFSKLFSIPPPVVVARSLGEAHHLAKEARKYDVIDGASNPEKAARVTVLDKALDQLEESVRDQTERLDSINEGSTGRRRPRGVVRGRDPAS